MARAAFLFAVACAWVCIAIPASGTQLKTGSKRIQDVVYGRKFGMALTLDVFQPAQNNGYGILFLVNGGWFSSHDKRNMVHVDPSNYVTFLRRGYTVFAIVTSSQPRFTIPEEIQDVQRAVRFVRYNASKYHIHPNHLGMTGSSSGGELTLMAAVQVAVGKPNAVDPIDRVSSAIQAAACFFPPTDFLNWGAPGVDGVGLGSMAPLKAAFGPLSDTEQGRQTLGREISPIYFVTSKLPPTLIIHGDADRVVPIQQARIFVRRAQEVHAPSVELIVRKGKGHGWGDFWKSQEDLNAFAGWFDEYLRGVDHHGNIN